MDASDELLRICRDGRGDRHSAFLAFKKLVDRPESRDWDWDSAFLASVETRQSVIASTIVLTRRLRKSTIRTGLIRAIGSGDKHVAIVLITRGADNLTDAFVESVVHGAHSIANWLVDMKHPSFDVHRALGRVIDRAGSATAQRVVRRYMHKMDADRVKSTLAEARCWAAIGALVRDGTLRVDWPLLQRALVQGGGAVALQMLPRADTPVLATALEFAMATGDAMLAARVLDVRQELWQVDVLADAVFQAPRARLGCVDQLLEHVQDGSGLGRAVVWRVIRRCIEADDCVLLSHVLSTLGHDDLIVDADSASDAVLMLRKASPRACVQFACDLPLCFDAARLCPVCTRLLATASLPAAHP